jgi:uncharacterized protein (DUF433 family)
MEDNADNPTDPIATKLNDHVTLDRLVRQAVTEAVGKARKLGFLDDNGNLIDSFRPKTTDRRNLITQEADKRNNKPCIRDLRISVQDVLEWMAAGREINDIVHDYPELTREDITACLAYAAECVRNAGSQK